MPRKNASSIPAKMIYNKAIWDFTENRFVNNTMRIKTLPAKNY